MGTKNSGSLWTKGDVKTLKSAWKKKLSRKKIAKMLGRTEMAVLKKATMLGIRAPAYYRPFVLPKKKFVAKKFDKPAILYATPIDADEVKDIIVGSPHAITITDEVDVFPQSVDDDTLTGGVFEEPGELPQSVDDDTISEESEEEGVE